MVRPLLASLTAALVLASTPALAQFEGRLDYVMKGMGGHGAEEAKKEGWAREAKVTFYAGSAGGRSEVALTVPDGKGGSRPLQVVMLWRAAEPKKTVMLNPEQRTYSVMSRDDAPVAGRTKQKVVRLGSDRVAGYACEKVRLTSDGGRGQQEVCITKALGTVPFMARMSADDEDDVFAELRRAGVEGIPVSWRSFDEDGKPGMSMELASAKRQGVPASMFAVPAGYKETGMAGVYATPEQQKQMDAAMKQMQERMKDMPPEQRKQMEEMMKKYGAGAK